MQKTFTLFIIAFAINVSAQNGFTSLGSPTGYTTSQLNNKNALVIDNTGNKWVAFQKIGLGKFDGSNWTMYDVSNSSLPSDTVNALAVDGANNMWIGTLRGLAKFDGSNWTIFNISNSSIPADNVISVAVNGTDIWVGTRSGAAIYNGSTWATYNTSNSGIASDTVQCFAFDQSGNIFLGTPKGLSRLNGSTWTTFNMNNSPLLSDNISCLYYYQGNLWIGTTNGGLHKYSSGTIIHAWDIITDCQASATPPPAANISSICEGPSGGIVFSSSVWGIPLLEIFPSLGQLKTYDSTYFIGSKSYLAYNNASGLLFFVNDIPPSTSNLGLYSFDANSYTGKTLVPYPPSMKFLDINEVNTMILNRGDMHWDLANAKYEVPKCSGINSVFASAIWMGGYDTGGQLHVAGQTYHQTGNDFWPGPLDTINAECDTATSNAYDKIWKIDRYKIEEFKYYFALGLVQSGNYIPDNDILTWPAHGSGAYPKNLSPFTDVDGDGFYDPINDGDYPIIRGDQELYAIFNDNTVPPGIHGETGGLPFGVEIHLSAYAFTCPAITDSMEALNYTTLYHYDIYNRSATQYDSVYFGYWQDIDLGCYTDDYVGCHPAGNYGYAYNGDSIDEVACPGYGPNPPMISTVVLNGPLAEPNDSIDNNNDGTIDEIGEKNLLGHFHYYNSDATPQGNPQSPLGYYYFLSGRWQDGTPVTYGGPGYGGTTPTRFMFPDFPYTSGWNEITAGNVPADRRFLMSSGPFTILPGAKTELDFAIVWSRDTSLAYGTQAYFDKNLKDNQKIQQWFVADSFPSCLLLNVAVEEANQTLKNELTLYPNPATDILFVSYKPQTKNFKIEIMDVMGRTLSINHQPSTITPIDVSKLPQGLYLVKVMDGDLVFSKRFVKE